MKITLIKSVFFAAFFIITACVKTPAHIASATPQVTSTKSWTALEASKEKLYVSFQLLVSGRQEGVCAGSDATGVDSVILDRLTSMTGAQVAEARQFILGNAAAALGYLSQDLRSMAYLSASPFVIAGMPRSAATSFSATPPTGYFTDDISTLSQDAVDALMAHELGHLMVDPAVGHRLNDTESTASFSTGMTKLDDIGACLVAFAHYRGQTERFILSLYQDVLHRRPSPDELSAAVALLATSHSDETSRRTLAGNLLSAPEASSILIADIFQQFLGRAPSDGEIQAELTAHNFGLNGGSPSELQVMAKRVFSEEYYNLQGKPGSFELIQGISQQLIHRPLTPSEYDILENSSGPSGENPWTFGDRYFYLPNATSFPSEERAVRVQYYIQKYLRRAAAPEEARGLANCTSGDLLPYYLKCSGLLDLKVSLLGSEEYYRSAGIRGP